MTELTDKQTEKYSRQIIIEKIEKKTEKRKNLISYFIILAIISFLFETLILKFWKN